MSQARADRLSTLVFLLNYGLKESHKINLFKSLFMTTHNLLTKGYLEFRINGLAVHPTIPPLVDELVGGLWRL